MIKLKEFFFYLDAWQYCMQYNLPVERIQRKDWTTWTVAAKKAQSGK